MSNHVKDIEVALTDGAWRIICYTFGLEGQRSFHAIQHECPGTFTWKGHTSWVSKRGLPCKRCNQSPPEGLQVAFWFLKETL